MNDSIQYRTGRAAQLDARALPGHRPGRAHSGGHGFAEGSHF